MSADRRAAVSAAAARIQIIGGFVGWSNYGAGVWWSSVGDGSLLLLHEGSPHRSRFPRRAPRRSGPRRAAPGAPRTRDRSLIPQRPRRVGYM